MNIMHSEQLEQIQEKLDSYDNNLISLTKRELEELYTQKAKLITYIKQNCSHDSVDVWNGYVVDVGYGCDRTYYHYDIICNQCGTNLTGRCEDFTVKITKEPMDLNNAIELYMTKEAIDSETLNQLGFEIQQITNSKLIRKKSL